MKIFQYNKKENTDQGRTRRPSLHLPAAEMSSAAAIIGTVARAVVLWLGIYALALFIAETFGLIYAEKYETLHSGMVVLRGTSGYITEGAILLTAAIASAFLAVGLQSKYTAVAVPLGALAYILHLATTFGNIPIALENMFRRLFNEIVTQMASNGFYQFSEYRMSDSYSYDQSLLIKEAVILLTIILSVLIFSFMFRRVHPIPSCITVLAVIVPILTYNISKATFGFAFILVFTVAAIVMWFFDTRYGKRATEYEARKSRRIAEKAERAEKRKASKEKKQSEHNARFSAYIEELRKSGDKKAAAKASADVKLKLKKEKANAERIKREEASEKKAALRREKAEAQKASRELTKKMRSLPKLSPERAELSAKLNAKKQLKKEKTKEKQKAQRERSRQKRANNAAAGFAGVTALAIAFAAIIAPYQISKRNFPIIEQIEQFMYTTRDYVTMLLTGDDVDLNEMSLYRELAELEPRKISLDARELSNTKLYSIHSGYNSPVYLRTWVASDYSLQDSEWTSANYDEIKNYRTVFGEDFTPDSLTARFFHLMFPEKTTVSEVDHYESFAQYGFIMHQTGIKKLANTDRLLPLPSIHDSIIGILNYDSLVSSKLKYSNYYDGVMSSSFFKTGSSFSTLTYSRYMRNDSASQNSEKLYLCYISAKVYCKLGEIRKSSQVLGDISDSEIIAQPEIIRSIDTLNEYFGETIIEAYPDIRNRNEFNEFYLNAILDHYEIPDELKQATVNMVLGESADEFRLFYEQQNIYENYVLQNYQSKSESELINALSREILGDLTYSHTEGTIPYYYNAQTNEFVCAHDVIMTVIDYFRDNYTYTLTPDATDIENSEFDTVLEQFLFETKSGYCSHFATAAAMLLREYGFAVRYCEGYLASGFKRESDKSEALPYTTDVLESDSHAWIEVYFPALGWVTYECTPTFVELFYSYPDAPSTEPEPPETDDPSESTDTPNESTSPIESDSSIASSEPADTSNEEEPNERNSEVLKRYLRISITLAILAVIAAIGVKLTDIIKKRAESAIDIRVCLINAAMSKERYDIAPRKHTRGITRDISDHILNIFAHVGYPQKTGELPSEYANRLKIKYAGLSKKDLSVIIDLIQKEEFGHGLDYDELCCLAEYLREIAAGIYPDLKWYDRIRLRYLKHVL